MMMNKKKTLSFRVSSGLKNIIGRELISDKYIAIFELVKNSYDAKAEKVSIEFTTDVEGQDVIVIADDGDGMSYEDIIKKWLFVAYSEKNIKNRSKRTYRDEIKRQVAGAKGVGRFSCDRLGSKLQIETKRSHGDAVHVLELDWDVFEENDLIEFEEIPVEYEQREVAEYAHKSGTRLTISSLREPWSRQEYLRLKRMLMKLISPDADAGGLPFSIELIVPSEIKKDEEEKRKLQNKSEMNQSGKDRKIVNGLVKNDVFESLNIKTTSIDVRVSEDGDSITTTLYDRGEYIFTIEERNRDYPQLKNINIIIYFLNRQAKINFTRQMGVEPKNYGSVFIYKSGFRVNPFGDPGQDFFNIDQRKAQGWKRFLGTRELIGRIEIKGDNPGFIETSSRAHGFVHNAALDDLEALFTERALKPLEKYVVGLINWSEPTRNDPDHVITADEIGDEILRQLLTSIKSKDMLKVQYNSEFLLGAVDTSNNSTMEKTLKDIETHAIRERNETLLGLAKSVRERTNTLVEQNAHLAKENVKKDREILEKDRELSIVRNQNLFLNHATDQDVSSLIDSVHDVFILSDAIESNVKSLIQLLESKALGDEKIIEKVKRIYVSNERIKTIASLIIHGSRSIESLHDGDIYSFISQYLEKDGIGRDIKYTVIKPEFECVGNLNPVQLSMIIENIVSNSRKAKATELKIEFAKNDDGIVVSFSDNGVGIPEGDDVSQYFEWGYSANWSRKGAGVGLPHIKKVVEESGGRVFIDTAYETGFKIDVRLNSE